MRRVKGSMCGCVGLLAAAIAGLGATVEASANDAEWYVAGGGSVSQREETDGAIANAPAPGSTVRTKNSFDPGVGAQIAVGRDFGRFRVEAELGYTRVTQDSYTAIVPPTGKIFADVEAETTRAMINGFIDFPLGRVEPFVGVGLGQASTNIVFVSPRAPFPTEQPRTLFDDTDSGFAYQLTGGIAAPINDKVKLTVQYRWFDAGDWSGLDFRGERVSYEYASDNLDVGLRVQF